MIRSLIRLVLCAFVLFSTIDRLTAESPEITRASQQLKAYVGQPDDVFRWEIRQQGRIGNCDYARLHLVSQQWYGMTWKHVLYVLKPDTATERADSAIMLIGGGAWKPEWGENGPAELKLPSEAAALSSIASSISSPTIILQQVPNQPLLGDRYEDAIIAETFRRYMQQEGEDWPLLLPMVKSATRAMDACQAFCHEQWNMELKRFTLTGASKRGWTTWLTSAVDPRVDALAPMVIDMLNMSDQMRHQVATWGDFSEQIADYTELQLPKFIDTPRGQALQSVVDPYRYREQLKQPKLLIFGTNDRYWPLDACNLYWKELRGQKHLLYVPNQGHGIKDYPRILGAITALHRSQNGGEALPKLEWNLENQASGGIYLTGGTDRKPTEVRVWTTTAPTRDFRDAQWQSKTVALNDEQRFQYEHHAPADGFGAMFCELVYPYQPMPASFCTNVSIVQATK